MYKVFKIVSTQLYKRCTDLLSYTFFNDSVSRSNYTVQYNYSESRVVQNVNFRTALKVLSRHVARSNGQTDAKSSSQRQVCANILTSCLRNTK